MEIRTTETERTHRGTPGFSVRRGQPGAGFRVYVKRPVRREGGVRLGHSDRRRKDFVMQRQSCLNQTRHASRAFRVANHRLHRANGTIPRRRASVSVNLSERFDLYPISDDSSRAVGLDQTNRARRDLRMRIRALENADLPLMAWGCKPSVLAVT